MLDHFAQINVQFQPESPDGPSMGDQLIMPWRHFLKWTLPQRCSVGSLRAVQLALGTAAIIALLALVAVSLGDRAAA